MPEVNSLYQMIPSLKSSNMSCGRVSAVLLVMFIGYLVLIQQEFTQSPNIQNYVWFLASVGMFGNSMSPSLPGVPPLCGNANPITTLSWMNPVDFNITTINHKPMKYLHRPIRNAPIFVVGCGHSGTTELISLLDRHPLVYAYLDGPGMEFAIQPNSFDSPWGLESTTKHDDQQFARLARRNSAIRWAVKSPSNVCRIGYILRSLPYSRIIMMVRDGRDTLVSLKERYPNKDVDGPLILRRWVNDNTAGLLYKDDPRLMVVRLEDFSQHPREVIPAILTHVGLPVTWKKSAQMLLDAAKAMPTSTSVEAKGLYRAATKAKALEDLNLLDHLISPSEPGGGGANSTFRGVHKKTKNSNTWPFGSDNSGLKEHDRLRRYQISQPLKPVVAKWPQKMTEEDKAIFKANPQAMKLLEYFKYDSGDGW